MKTPGGDLLHNLHLILMKPHVNPNFAIVQAFSGYLRIGTQSGKCVIMVIMV
jgi:hypothetical protein